MPSAERYVVVVSRLDVTGAAFTVEEVVLGPFRRIERAEARATTIRRLAAKYDEAEGTLHVTVEPLRLSVMAAREAMDRLYGSIV